MWIVIERGSKYVGTAKIIQLWESSVQQSSIPSQMSLGKRQNFWSLYHISNFIIEHKRVVLQSFEGWKCDIWCIHGQNLAKQHTCAYSSILKWVQVCLTNKIGQVDITYLTCMFPYIVMNLKLKKIL